jgi:nucleoid-associated protein YgaU
MRRNLLLGSGGAVIIAGALAVFLLYGRSAAERRPAPDAANIAQGMPAQVGSPTPAVARVPAAPAPKAAPTAPSFDIVRVSPDGNAVIAGRAEPGAHVTVLDSGKPIAEVQADSRGEWVALPEQKLAPGARELSLASRVPGNSKSVTSQADVAIVVPQQKHEAVEPPVAVLLPHDAGTMARPLQLPGPKPGAGTLGLDVLEYDAAGKLALSGRAAPGAKLRLSLNKKPLGGAVADAKGHWSVRPEQPVAPGRYSLHLEELRPDGTVARRADLPFQRDVVPAQARAGGWFTVQPGNSLWRIARSTYGSGLRYTIIYAANEIQIEDPDLIYPGQIFRLPAAAK